MRQVPVDLIGGFYTDDSLAWSCQDTVNYLPVRSESQGTRTQTKLVGVPGCRPWANLGLGVNRGLHDVEGKLFAVCGSTLYQVSPGGLATSRGTIPGVGRVSMAHNQITNGNQLLIVNGSSGYVWDTVTETLTKITDDGYPGAFLSDFVDGYLMQVEPFGRFLFHSNLSDALDYNTLDRFEAETAPDRIVSMLVDHLEVWAFGERTIDIFENTGQATGTFQNKRISIQIGCVGKFTPARIDNSVMWVGDDRVIYRAQGYQPVRVSTRAIEVALSGYSLADLREAFSFVWSDRGHKCYVLTIPGGQTWCYDVASQAWSRLATYHPSRDIAGRWRLNSLVYSNGQWIGGDYQSGQLYVLDWDHMMDGDAPLVSERTSPVMHNNGNRFSVDAVELDFDTGESSTGPSDDREVTFCYSKDKGRNWSNLRSRSLGELGEYSKRVTFNRLGQHRQLVAKIRVSSPVKRTLLGATAQVTPADS